MAKRCAICGKQTMFFIWTSSRNFPRHKFPGYDKMSDIQKLFLKRTGLPVCMSCYHKLIETDVSKNK